MNISKLDILLSRDDVKSVVVSRLRDGTNRVRVTALVNKEWPRGVGATVEKAVDDMKLP